MCLKARNKLKSKQECIVNQQSQEIQILFLDIYTQVGKFTKAKLEAYLRI